MKDIDVDAETLQKDPDTASMQGMSQGVAGDGKNTHEARNKLLREKPA